MPTLPREPRRPADAGPQSHTYRKMAESFGVDAQRYDRARPNYPQPLIDRIVASAPGREALDVGCGTGIVARQLRTAGCTVLGVEPDARMAAFARDSGVDVEVGTFEAWEPVGRRFDMVVAGQAWHWVDPIAGAAQASRVLRPGGQFAAFWNAFGAPPGLSEAFTEVFREAMPDSAPLRGMTMTTEDPYGAMCDKAADGMVAAAAFGAPRRWRFEWDRTYTRDQWLDVLPTTGLLTRAAPAVLAKIVDGVGAAIDAAGGSFPMHYTTVAVTAPRNAA